MAAYTVHSLGVEILCSGEDGKISSESIAPNYQSVYGTTRVVSISQVNECGLLYTLDELRAIGDAAKDKGMLFHMDGVRFLLFLSFFVCGAGAMLLCRCLFLCSCDGYFVLIFLVSQMKMR